MSVSPGTDTRFRNSGPPATVADLSDSALAVPEIALSSPATRSVPKLSPASSRTALSPPQRVVHSLLAVIWLVVVAQFCRWWLPHAAAGTPWLAWPVSAALAYQTVVLPTVFWFFVGRMRTPVWRLPPANLRVAMITLCVPAFESREVIRQQLLALRNVESDHQSWILDEGGSLAVRELATELGVRYFTRHGIERWNQPGPPFQRATKAGNVNAWLDHISATGDAYDVFVQLDIDHRPTPEYLDRVLGHFEDADVAWVQAPSVCTNVASWTARGLAEQELVFQGPLQMGFYGNSRTPFIIGSHTSYRMSAIREIGGFQPTRAEDHLDTIVLASRGYRGVFVPEIIATGDGPDTYATYLRQQFAWAHSMIQVFFTWTPRLLPRYSFRQALQFLFAQSWYTLWATCLALLWFAPLVALLSGRPISDATLGEYLLYAAPVILVGWVMWVWARPWFQPQGIRLSWRGMILEMARWPVVLWALVNVVLRVKHEYMITPKGKLGQRGPSGLTMYGPYLMLASTALAALYTSSIAEGRQGTRGYLLLVMINFGLAIVCVVVPLGYEVAAQCRQRGPWHAARHRAGICAWLGGLTAASAWFVVHYWAVVTYPHAL